MCAWQEAAPQSRKRQRGESPLPTGKKAKTASGGQAAATVVSCVRWCFRGCVRVHAQGSKRSLQLYKQNNKKHGRGEKTLKQRQRFRPCTLYTLCRPWPTSVRSLPVRRTTDCPSRTSWPSSRKGTAPPVCSVNLCNCHHSLITTQPSTHTSFIAGSRPRTCPSCPDWSKSTARSSTRCSS